MPISKDSVILSCLSLIIKMMCLGCFREIHKKLNISYLTHFFVKIFRGHVSKFICSCLLQIRLDFEAFVITGPSTATESIGKALNGNIVSGAAGVEVSQATQCLTDTFSVSNQNTLPLICGTNTGYHGKISVEFEGFDYYTLVH